LKIADRRLLQKEKNALLYVLLLWSEFVLSNWTSMNSNS
jgi:hypothetical protein